MGKTKKRKSSDSRCQCEPGCKYAPMPGSPFCKAHQHKCARISPRTGFEPDYNPSKYNKHPGLRNSQNCFAYAFHHTYLPKHCTKDSCNASFHQPGIKSGHPRWSEVNGKRCPDLIGRLLGDVPSIRLSSFTKRCPKTMTKAAVVTDENEDYHFYRQDSNGYWSHKPGSTDVTNKDASGRFIYDPALASRFYPKTGLDYKNFCGYFCLPADKPIKIQRAGKRSMRRGRKTRKSLRK
jgi:hypothetical protein